MEAQHRQWDGLVEAGRRDKQGTGQVQDGPEEATAQGERRTGSCSCCRAECSVPLKSRLFCKPCASVRGAVRTQLERLHRLTRQGVDCSAIAPPEWSTVKALLGGTDGIGRWECAREPIRTARALLDEVAAKHKQLE